MEELQQRSTAVQQVATSALRSAIEHSSLPLLFLSRGLQRGGQILSTLRYPRITVIVGFCLAAVLALWLIPAELKIEGRGKILPKIRRDLFAAADGVVRGIHVQHGANVKQGELLLELRQSQLDFESTRVLGEIQTAQQRMAAVQALRLSATTDRGEGREKYTQLASEEEELKVQLKSLAEQRKILELRQSELAVKSPMDGQVLTWDVAELLTARPVQRGQVLMTIGDLRGPWELEVELPDDQAGHLLAARSQNDKLPVSFILASSPGVVHWGQVSGVSLAADADENRRPVLLVTVDFDKLSLDTLKPGLAAIPKIHCGSHSLGFVWFHRAWEALQTWIFF
jgi:multidrug efflux pump subunit AcrA (membrane-fusion protein)